MTRPALVNVILAVGVEASSATDAAGTTWVDLPARAWRSAAEGVAAAGGILDWLSGVDLGVAPVTSSGEVELVACYVRGGEAVAVRTVITYSDQVPTVSDLFASASWHERETAEMLGVTFAGGDPRRLLLPESVDGYPLRRDFPLPARLQTPWPGAEPGRRARVPGINPEWQQ